jgi:hypothetical protein
MVAKVYGRYAPTSDERDRWERIATSLDAEREAENDRKSAEMGTATGTYAPNDASQPRVSDWLVR